MIGRLLRSLFGLAPKIDGVPAKAELYQPPASCQARQHSDQMVCRRCDLAWDVNDPEPPKCRRRRSDMRKVLGCLWPECKGVACICATNVVGLFDKERQPDRRTPEPPAPPPARKLNF